MEDNIKIGPIIDILAQLKAKSILFKLSVIVTEISQNDAKRTNNAYAKFLMLLILLKIRIRVSKKDSTTIKIFK